MNALVVYDSEFHNTEAVARAIAEAIDARFVHARDADFHFEEIDLLIAGAPTQGGRPTGAMQAFLAGLPADALKNQGVAAFDTRIDFSTQNFALKALMKMIGYAAPKISKILTAKGGSEIVPPEGFIVAGKEGPLRDGEVDRAATWARGVVAQTAARKAA